MSLPIWLDKDMTSLAPPHCLIVRQPLFSNAAIRIWLSVKWPLRLPPRPTAAMAASVLRPAGMAWPVPDCSTLCRKQKTLT